MLYFSESFQEPRYPRALDAAILYYSETFMLSFIVTLSLFPSRFYLE